MRPIRTIVNSHSDVKVNLHPNFTGVNTTNLVYVLPTESNFSVQKASHVTNELTEPIGVIISPRDKTCFIEAPETKTHISRENLIKIKCTSNADKAGEKNLRICSFNPRSVKNKTISMCDYIISNDFDVVALSETWRGTSDDKICVHEPVPSGYNTKHVPRRGCRGGGVEKHDPVRTKTFVMRPGCPWFSEEIHHAKHLRRKLERKWRKSRLTIDLNLPKSLG